MVWSLTTFPLLDGFRGASKKDVDASVDVVVLLAFTLAGYNLEAIRSFTAKKEDERTAAPPKRTRKKRRTGTWAHVIGSDRPQSGRSPPPG